MPRKHLLAVLSVSLYLFTSQLVASPKVLVSVAPIHSLVQTLLKGAFQSQLLLPVNVDMHHFSFRPSDIKKIDSAEIVIWVGAGFETNLAKVLKAQSFALKEFRLETILKDTMRGDDPHVWLDPELMRSMLGPLTDELVGLAPIDEQLIRNNHAQLDLRLQQLSTEIKQRMSGFTQKHYAVFHDAYSYFSEVGKLKSPIVLETSVHGQLSLKRLRELVGQSSVAVECVLMSESDPVKKLTKLLKPLGVYVLTTNAYLQEGYFLMLETLMADFELCFEKDLKE